MNCPFLYTRWEGEHTLSVIFNMHGVFTTQIGDSDDSIKIQPNQLKSLFAGFILSLEKTFFAVQVGRHNLLIIKNLHGNTNDLKGCPAGYFFTREGPQKGPMNLSVHGERIENPFKGSEWKIGTDGVCRLVKENSAKAQSDSATSQQIEEENEKTEIENSNNNCKCITQ